MFSQTSLTNRRKFLERSVLGFGGALLLPGLLASCNDHIIPNPNPGPDMPDDELTIDWKKDTRTAVIFGIGQIPEVGHVLSDLTGALWPDKSKGVGDPWEQMKLEMEAVVDQKLNTDRYNDVKSALGHLCSDDDPTCSPSGLAGSAALYSYMAHDSTIKPESILEQFKTTVNLFVERLGVFQAEQYEVLLLPLFTQYANMYLSLLRDGVLYGLKWGMETDIHNLTNDRLEKAITSFTAYVDKWYPMGELAALAKSAGNTVSDQNDGYYLEPFKTVNAYIRQTTLNVLDYRNTWPFYSVTNYPQGKQGPDGKPIKAVDLLPREIYSDPYGSTSGNPTIPIPSPLNGAPKSLPTQISVWSGDRVDAVQVFYPQGSGPGGTTQTPRMGGGGGDNKYPLGEVLINQPNNPITQFRVITESSQLDKNGNMIAPVVSLLQLGDYSSTPTRAYGGKDIGGVHSKDWGWSGLEYPDEAISSIYVNGAAKGWLTANCVVVGFKYWDSPKAALRAVSNYYVTSPREKSMADLVKAFPGVAIPADLINAELKAARLAHWAWIEASARKMK